MERGEIKKLATLALGKEDCKNRTDGTPRPGRQQQTASTVVIRRLEATIRLLFVFNQWKGSGYGLNWGEKWCFNRIKQRTLIIFVNILLKTPTEEFILQINIQPYFIRIL